MSGQYCPGCGARGRCYEGCTVAEEARVAAGETYSVMLRCGACNASFTAEVKGSPDAPGRPAREMAAAKVAHSGLSPLCPSKTFERIERVD